MGTPNRSIQEWRRLITSEWFRSIGARGDPIGLEKEFREFLSRQEEPRKGPRPAGGMDQFIRKRVLKLASGLGDTSIRNYLKGDTYLMGKDTLASLVEIDQKMGFEPVDDVPFPSGTPSRPRPRDVRRVAVFTELNKAPSFRYHQAIFHSILERSQQRNISVAFHEINDPSKLTHDVKTILRAHNYDGLIFIRLQPPAELRDALAKMDLPVVLIHADKVRYASPPVLGNIVPNQQKIGDVARAHVSDFLQRTRGNRKNGERKAVIVSMHREGTEGSIRDERIELIKTGLESCDPPVEVVCEFVDDYRFIRAMEVFSKHHLKPDEKQASVYVCLSDTVAVMIRQLLDVFHRAKGEQFKNVEVLGFDDLIAEEGSISSFKQDFAAIGRIAIDRISDFLDSDPREYCEGGKAEVLTSEIGFSAR